MSDAKTGLKQAHDELKSALEPLGVELGGEVLFVWVDRDRHGHEPLPPAALRALANWATKHLADPG